MRHVKEGTGWRLGWDPDASVFKGLVGGDGWAIEMTQAEFEDFCRLSQQLAETLQTLSAELMDEERVACELETPRVWTEAEGFPSSYCLRFILLSGRGAEGAWPADVVAELTQSISSLKLF